MWTWLKGLWIDEGKFERGLRGLLFGVAMAATTAAGAAIMDGDLGKVTSGQWVRFGIAVIGGTLGGATGAGTKPSNGAAAAKP